MNNLPTTYKLKLDFEQLYVFVKFYNDLRFPNLFSKLVLAPLVTFCYFLGPIVRSVLIALGHKRNVYLWGVVAQW